MMSFCPRFKHPSRRDEYWEINGGLIRAKMVKSRRDTRLKTSFNPPPPITVTLIPDPNYSSTDPPLPPPPLAPQSTYTLYH